MKETYYFKHDFNSRNDPKCSALVNDFGMLGIGFFWCLIEILHEQEEGKLRKFPKLYDAIAFQLRIEKEAVTKLIEALLHDYNLLQEDENFIWSDRVLKNLEERKLKYLQKAELGRIGGIKSGITRSKSKLNEAKLEANEAKLEANELKEKKEKKTICTTNVGFDFDKLWYQYPKKDGRKAAERSFNATVKTQQDYVNIQKALANYLQTKNVAEGNMQYIKNGSTWFNNWQDWIDKQIQLEPKQNEILLNPNL